MSFVVIIHNTLKGAANLRHPEPAAIVMRQEMWSRKARRRLRKASPECRTWYGGYGCTITWHPAHWEKIAGDSWRAHRGVLRVTPSRGPVRTLLRNLQTGDVLDLFDLHPINGARHNAWKFPGPASKVGSAEWRAVRWDRFWRKTVAKFERGRAERPDALQLAGGDLNCDERLLPDLPGAMRYVGRRIDWLYVDDRLTVTDFTDLGERGSDHPMLRVAVARRADAPREEPTMATGIYLEDHPPRVRQFRDRRAAETGCIVVHTAESVMDTVGPDTGAEAVAEFIADRTTYGSYHRLCDSDSVVPLVRLTKAAYGDGTGSNEFAIHISFACRTTDWAKMSAERRARFLAQGAAAAAEAMHYLRKYRGIAVPLERITKAESDAGRPGFISHGERDPGRRTDPGADFPWNEFFDAIRARTQPKPDMTRGEVVDGVLGALRRLIRRTEGRPHYRAKLRAARRELKEIRERKSPWTP